MITLHSSGLASLQLAVSFVGLSVVFNLTLFRMGDCWYADRMGGGGVKITPTLTVELKELES